MAEMILVRHGQASAFSDDYDRLSELGHRQARVLGDFWVDNGIELDAVVVGSLRRHRETLSGVQDAYRAAGKRFPEPQEDAGWNEYDAHTAMKRLAPELGERDPVFGKLITAALENLEGPDRDRHFQRAFEAFMAAWVAGDIADDEVETFAQFHQRVAEARSRVLGQSGIGKVAVFTSGGPIGTAVQLTMQAPVSQFLALNSRVRNASLTHLLFSKARVSLDQFNLVHHLEDHDGMVTFR